jgi:transposase InsO family protein
VPKPCPQEFRDDVVKVARSRPEGTTLHGQSSAASEELRIEIVTWIERTYHRRRRQASLGRWTSIDYEIFMTPQTATAA